MLFLIAEHVNSEGEAVGGVQGRRPGLDHRSRLPSSLPAHFFSDEDFFGVTEEVKNPNLTADTVFAGMYGLWP